MSETHTTHTPMLCWFDEASSHSSVRIVPTSLILSLRPMRVLSASIISLREWVCDKWDVCVCVCMCIQYILFILYIQQLEYIRKNQYISVKHNIFAISGFRREADENCALQGYYAANSGNFLPTFRDNLSVPSSGVKENGSWPWKMVLLTLEDGTDRLPWSVGKKLPPLAA